MDIGVYISELLARNGEISVPGLGFLALQKVPGYYNETDGRFYPPRSVVQFDPQQIDDDETLAQYIAEQKNISVSSAKYFAEKYVATVREDALVKEVPVGDLGSFLADQGRLIFIPSQKSTSNPAFFGLAPVNLTRSLPSPAPIVTPPASTTPPPSYSNYTTLPPTPDFNRPDAFQGGRTYPPAPEYIPPAPTPPTPAPEPDPKNRQALVDAFNASNKGAYAEQGIPEAFQTRRPDLYTNNPPPVHNTPVEEEEAPKRPVALYILIGVVVLLLLSVLAVKQFMPAKFAAITSMFGHKSDSQVDDANAKKSDTVKIQEPKAVIPPPQVDPATRDSLNKIHARDSIKAIKTADSLKKVQKADSIKYAIARIADAKKRRADSLENVRLTKKQREKDKADSVKNARLTAEAEKKRLAAAALAAKQEAKKKGQTVPVVVPATAPPVAMPVPDKNTKMATPSVQKTMTSGDVSSGEVDPSKTWCAVVSATSVTADAKIAGLKKIGIDATMVERGSHVYVVLGAYAKNSEADAAVNKFKSKGAADAYVTQIRPNK